ncbi:MAG: hypothetical protein KDK91_12900, partial [Gammaproteobacteria bacterium]|nr:hypothetical protein [Gammaproteobacteria bacterium]
RLVMTRSGSPGAAGGQGGPAPAPLPLRALSLDVELRPFDFASKEGQRVGQQLGLRLQAGKPVGQATGGDGWPLRLTIDTGQTYLHPLFFDFGQMPLQVQARMRELPGHWVLDGLQIDQPGLLRIRGRAALGRGVGSGCGAELSLLPTAIEPLASQYLKPFLLQWQLLGDTPPTTPAENWQDAPSGRLAAELSYRCDTGMALQLGLRGVDLSLSGRALRIQGLDGVVGFSELAREVDTDLRWREVDFGGVTSASARLRARSRTGVFELSAPLRLPVLGGALRLDGLRVVRPRVSAAPAADVPPTLAATAEIEPISLEALSDRLDLLPLRGSISGRIPSLELRGEELRVGSGVEIALFGGRVRVTDLSVTRLLSPPAFVGASLELDGLALGQLTEALSFGAMSGRLSGYVRDLRLVGGQPVAFDAYLHTPEGDDSRHRISQRAVDDLASLGGGVAGLSSIVLNLFSDFAYDRVGLGCRLRRGVCQMRGIEPAPQGFYILRGSGLPSINVIGYNAEVDWQSLLQRLARIRARPEVDAGTGKRPESSSGPAPDRRPEAPVPAIDEGR